jgi:hypothetical protein
MNFSGRLHHFSGKSETLLPIRVAPLGRSSSGAIKVNMTWLHYTDHHLAPLARSQGGSFMPVIEWLHIGGHQQWALPVCGMLSLTDGASM